MFRNHKSAFVLCLLLISFLILPTAVYAAEPETDTASKDRLVLFVDSPRVMIGNDIELIDESNIDVTAIVKNGRTLVPTRFIAEKFQAKVDYDGKAKKVNILYGNNNAEITIGSSKIIVNGKTVVLDTPAQVLNGRTLLPLRTIAQDILNKKIFYEKGLIAIEATDEALAAYKDQQLVQSLISSLKTADKAGYYQLQKPLKGDLVANIQTSEGDIKIKLFPLEAPKAVDNFVKLSEKGYYNGVIFHRVIKDFMIQGGDPEGTGRGGESIWGTPFQDEFSSKLIHLRGALSMANSGPNTNGSQFFIVQNSQITSEIKKHVASKISKEVMSIYEKYGGTPWLDNGYSIFGQVYEGLDVVDKIAKVNTNPQNNKPLKDITIKKIEVKNYE